MGNFSEITIPTNQVGRIFKTKRFPNGLKIEFREKPPQSQVQTSEFDQQILQEIHSIKNGVLWIIQAIIINELNSSRKKWTSNKFAEFLNIMFDKHKNRFEEIYERLSVSLELKISIDGYHIFSPLGKPGVPIIKYQLSPDEIHESTIKFLEAYCMDLYQETLNAREMMSQCSVIMVAGHQGVGKGVVTQRLEKMGYKVYSMSTIVKHIVAAWGFDPTETIDKIVGGQLAKELFHQDVLVQLIIHYLVSDHYTKVVLDGPRVIEEAQAVLKLGGKVIGVIADNDPETDQTIRKSRILQRAEVDKNRASDANKFDARENIERSHIDQILGLIPQNLRILNALDATSEFLSQQLETIVGDSSPPKSAGFRLFTRLRWPF